MNSIKMFMVPTKFRDFFFHDGWFAENWFHYDLMKERVSCVTHLEDLVGDKADVVPFPQRWTLPSIPNLDKEIFQDPTDPDLIRWQEEAGGMEISLDLHLYTPDEIKVYVLDDDLMISGRHEAWSEDGRKMVSHCFKRIFKLPERIGQENVESNLSKDGVLVVNVRMMEPGREGLEMVMVEEMTNPIKEKEKDYPAPDDTLKRYLSEEGPDCTGLL